MTIELISYIGLFVLCLAVLIKASDWFIDASELIGLTFGISPFIIGVTIVAAGTSLPELATSVAAVLQDESEIVVANVVGSNIANILMVLGLTAIMVKKINWTYDVMSVEIPLLLGSAVLLWFALRDQHVSMFEGFLFLIGLGAFLANTFSDNEKVEKPDVTAGWRSYATLLASGILVAISAKYTIVAIENMSGLLHINPEIIALSGVALGTSLPEVVVSVSAARKGKSEIAVGNVLGSNVFNTYAVMGIPSFLGPLIIPDNIVNFSLPFMVAVTFLFAMVCLTRRISRLEGVMLFTLYCWFITELYSNLQG